MKVSVGSPEDEYQGRFTVFRGNNDKNPLGIAISDPNTAGGANFALIDEMGADINGSSAHFDPGVSHSIAKGLDPVRFSNRIQCGSRF